MQLVIVESPGKAKTINQYLGRDYIVVACYGHMFDLLKKNGVDVNNKFEQNFQLIAKNKKHLETIINHAEKCDQILLATDPDREGEAIAWHILDYMLENKKLKKKTIKRVTFNQITKSAIQEAIAHPRDIYLNLVDAQKARRGLDYLVGFNLSPLLWKKIRPGLSAGRVQSPALRMIVEREQEIRNFQAIEYWDIWADFGNKLEAKLAVDQNVKIQNHDIKDMVEANAIVEKYKSKKSLKIKDIQNKERSRKSPPPFQTSTMQQESSKILGFSSSKTMQIAQKLYEGIEIDGEHKALITYMRTDSTEIAPEAIDSIRSYIETNIGENYLPKNIKKYVNKNQNAQEAHEAIRPIDIYITPKNLNNLLNKDALKLYTLIWQRTLASQIKDATIGQQIIIFSQDKGDEWRLSGTKIIFDGFLRILKEEKDEEENLLPNCSIGDDWDVNEYINKQHFTEPPARFSEASLIKTLEEYGIGRPSTYATIPTTLLKREYVILDKKRFHPTDSGEIVSQFLVNYFNNYVDYNFTADLENSLDDVAQGKKEYFNIMNNFWHDFDKKIKATNENVKRSDVTHEATGESCPECGKNLCFKLGKTGKFIGCEGYPECKYIKNTQSSISPPDHPCPKCSNPLAVKFGKYGQFYGCSTYPDCKYIENAKGESNENNSTNITCPECKEGKIVSKKSRFNKIFFACDGYPKCKYAIWNPPLEQACPKCAWPIMTLKNTKRYGEQIICPKCEYIIEKKDDV